MRRLGIIATFAILLVAAGADAEPQWLTLPPTPSLPKAAQSGYAPINGMRIWYAVFGRGEPVILLHGGLANADYWGNQVRALQKSYRVVVMDSRGHGRSTRNEQPYGYDLMAADVIGLMDYLKIPKAAIVGWSDGAIIGLDIAMHHPGAGLEAVRLCRQFRSERGRRHRQEPGVQRLYRARGKGIRKAVADAAPIQDLPRPDHQDVGDPAQLDRRRSEPYHGADLDRRCRP